MAHADRPVAGSFFSYLDQSDRAYLLDRAHLYSRASGTILLHQGDTTDHVLIIMSGWVRVYVVGQDGNVTLLALRGPGDIVGDAAAVQSGWARTATVSTLQDVTVCMVGREEFNACLIARPKIAVALLKNLYQRERDSDNSRIIFASSDVAQRVAAFLLRLADMHGYANLAGIVVNMPLTQQDIADSIGASRRSVARVLQTLRERGILDTGRRRFTINAPEVLRQLAGTT